MCVLGTAVTDGLEDWRKDFCCKNAFAGICREILVAFSIEFGMDI